MFRKIAFDTILLAPTERRIGKYNVYTITSGVADKWARKSVVVANKAGVLTAV